MVALLFSVMAVVTIMVTFGMMVTTGMMDTSGIRVSIRVRLRIGDKVGGTRQNCSKHIGHRSASSHHLRGVMKLQT